MFILRQSSSDSHWHRHWQSVWLLTDTRDSLYFKLFSSSMLIMPTFCNFTSCVLIATHFSLVGQQPSQRWMLIHCGKGSWFELRLSVSGFEIQTGLGSHLPGVASFTSPAVMGLDRPIIDKGAFSILKINYVRLNLKSITC